MKAKKSAKKPTMKEAFNAAQGPAVVRPPNPPAPTPPAADKGSYKRAMVPNVGKKLKKLADKGSYKTAMAPNLGKKLKK